jgi:hypothetical protein
MSAPADKAPKKEKVKRQTPEERLEAMRYNHIMYGPTDLERRLAPKKIDYGTPYLKHPKFLSLIAALRKGAAFQFEVTAADKVFTIATEGGQVTFNGRVIFYSRALNRYEDNLLLDRISASQFQTTDAFIHLIFAILRSFPEMGPVQLQHQRHRLYYGMEALESTDSNQGSNLLIGSFKHTKVQEKPRK